MPADRGLADDHGDELISRYTSLRHILITSLAERLRRMLAGRPLGEEPRTLAGRLISALRRDLPSLSGDAVRAAAAAGRNAADKDLRDLGRDRPPPTRLEVAGKVLDLARALESTHPRIAVWAEDSFRRVVFDVTLAEQSGSRLQMAQRSWSRLVGRGVTGFVDATGRRWSLESYVEMATRSRLADAAVSAHLDRLAEAGLDLVVVSDVAGECRLCREVEGKILHRTIGGRRSIEVEHATIDGRMVRVDVWGSVAEARRAGLWHRNCRHTANAFLPGVTKPPRHTEDPAGDAARQRQRELERQVRAWKLQADAALDPAAARVAMAHARARQAVLREHLAAHPELRRRPERERIGAAR